MFKKVEANKGVFRQVLSHGKDLMVVEFSFDEGALSPTHSHLHEQSVYIVKGCLQFDIAGKKIRLTQGQSIVIPSNTPHSAIAEVETVNINCFTPIRNDFLL